MAPVPPVNIEAMMAEELRRREEAAEQKLKDKLKRQIMIFNKEKKNFQTKTRHELNKQKKCLTLLEDEKFRELENYLSVISPVTEKLYMHREAVVKDLVRSIDVVQELVKKEKAETADVEEQIGHLRDQTLGVKKDIRSLKNEQKKFPIPSPFQMDNRVEQASSKYNKQMVKNKEIEKDIVDKLILRDIYNKEEKNLQKTLDEAIHNVTTMLEEISEVYEERDRAEATKNKVRDHLAKVKDKYEREILSISLQLSEDKKMEAFMRTKHKEITQNLRDQRKRELEAVDEFVRTKDIWTKAFEQIMAETGKTDMGVIVREFIDAEQENFSVFTSIGELIDANQGMKIELACIRDQNAQMEKDILDDEQGQQERIVQVAESVKNYIWKTQRCEERLAENSNTLGKFATVCKGLFESLGMDKSSMPICFDEEGEVVPEKVLELMSAMEKQVGLLLNDFAMVEMATRAIKFEDKDITPQEVELCRVPSVRIGPRDTKKGKHLIRTELLEEGDKIEPLSLSKVMTNNEIKEVVFETMMDDTMSGVGAGFEGMSFSSTQDMLENCRKLTMGNV